MTEPIRILVADDHTLFRDGLRALFASLPDLQVVGEAATGEQVVAQAAALQPDVILMDIQMPGVNGIEATRRIQDLCGLQWVEPLRFLLFIVIQLKSNRKHLSLISIV